MNSKAVWLEVITENNNLQSVNTSRMSQQTAVVCFVYTGTFITQAQQQTTAKVCCVTTSSRMHHVGKSYIIYTLAFSCQPPSFDWFFITAKCPSCCYRSRWGWKKYINQADAIDSRWRYRLRGTAAENTLHQTEHLRQYGGKSPSSMYVCLQVITQLIISRITSHLCNPATYVSGSALSHTSLPMLFRWKPHNLVNNTYFNKLETIFSILDPSETEHSHYPVPRPCHSNTASDIVTDNIPANFYQN